MAQHKEHLRAIDEVDARNGLVAIRDALKAQARKLGDAYEAAWRAA